MSVQKMSKRLTAPEITGRKGGDPIVALTSYHAHTAAIADKYVDFILVPLQCRANRRPIWLPVLPVLGSDR